MACIIRQLPTADLQEHDKKVGAGGHPVVHLTHTHHGMLNAPTANCQLQVYAEYNGADGYPVVQVTSAMAVVISQSSRRRLSQLSTRVPALLVNVQFSTLTVSQASTLQVSACAALRPAAHAACCTAACRRLSLWAA
jgi:hypothetical protein